MFDLWRKVFNGAHLGKTSEEERNRLLTLAISKGEEESGSLAYIGHKVARTHAASYLSPSERLNEIYNGISQVIHV